jgi:cytochrome c oxidase subunit 3
MMRAAARKDEHAHHFVNAEQQRDAATLGMWVFLASEVMFFGGLFTAFVFYREAHPSAFAEASRKLNVIIGSMNTAVLLTSSLTMAIAVGCAGHGDRLRMARYLTMTALLGCVFLAVKSYEYADKFHEHLVPGPEFAFDSPRAPEVQMFFVFYFVMTGVHALHLVIGICVLGILGWRVRYTKHLTAWRNSIETAGLYWHLIDIIWIFLFPFLYLLGRHR